MGQMRTLRRQMRNAKSGRAIGRIKGEPYRRVVEQDSLDNRFMYLHATKGWRNRTVSPEAFDAAYFDMVAGDRDAIRDMWGVFKRMMQYAATPRVYPNRG